MEMSIILIDLMASRIYVCICQNSSHRTSIIYQKPVKF